MSAEELFHQRKYNTEPAKAGFLLKFNYIFINNFDKCLRKKENCDIIIQKIDKVCFISRYISMRNSVNASRDFAEVFENKGILRRNREI